MKNKFFKMLSLNINYYLWIIFIFATITFLYDKFIGALQYFFLIVMGFVYYFNTYKRKKKLFSYVKTLTFDDNAEEIDSLEKFPLPVAIIDPTGKVVWNNSAFFDIVNEKNIYELPISDFIPSFDIDKLDWSEDKVKVNIMHNGCHYRVFGNITFLSQSDKTLNSYIVLY